MQYKEIEFKYDASDVPMDRFTARMEGLIKVSPSAKKMTVSSYDDYFTDKKGDFVRYRHNDSRGELTIKRKTTDSNNNERIEVNIPAGADNFEATEAFMNLLGYRFNFGIFKTAKIYWIDNVVIAYYVVYNKNDLREMRRFIEIEADEDHRWESEAQAWAHIEGYERSLSDLSISSRHRMKKSLFELFRKDTPKT